jgi:hypothetical protein
MNAVAVVDLDEVLVDEPARTADPVCWACGCTGSRSCEGGCDLIPDADGDGYLCTQCADRMNGGEA